MLNRTRRNWGRANVFAKPGVENRFDDHDVLLDRLDEHIKDLREKVAKGTETLDSPNPHHVSNADRLKDSLWVLGLCEERLPTRLLACPGNGGMEVSDWCKQIRGVAEETESPPIGTSTSLSTPTAVGSKAKKTKLRTGKRFNSGQKKVNVMFPLLVGMLPDSFSPSMSSLVRCRLAGQMPEMNLSSKSPREMSQVLVGLPAKNRGPATKMQQ